MGIMIFKVDEVSHFLCTALFTLVMAAAGCQGHQGQGGGGASGGYGDDSARVRINFQRLPDVVVETSTSGIPRNDVIRLRNELCEGREDDPVIFFQFIVAGHWHYYWICSSNTASRASSTSGKQRLQRWLGGFKRDAASQVSNCARQEHVRLLKGSHESGIRATAYCDGQIVLRFPDGGRRELYFNASARGRDRYSGGSRGRSCPACPACPTSRGRRCPACPPPRSCPPPRTCPPCDCSREAAIVARKSVKSWVSNKCRGLCDQIYKKCRSINPNTSLCYMISEYCATNCVK